jgi:hypothetical protein
MLMNLAGSMQGDAVYSEAARLCGEGNGRPSSRALFESSHLAPLSNAARERCRKAAVELAFAEVLCLV